MAAAVTEYWLDGSDVLFRLNDAWSQFAIENGAPHLLPSRVLGRSLWTFLDLQTATIYGQLFRRVRDAGQPITLQLRCDSPRIRRHMRMVVAPRADRQLRITCEMTDCREIAYSDATPARLRGVLRICSWCNRVHLPDGEWVNIEEAAPKMDVWAQPSFPQITHGICADCEAALLQQIENPEQ